MSDTDAETNTDKPTQGSDPSATPTEGELKKDKPISEDDKAKTANQESNQPTKPWRIKEVLTGWWNFVKSRGFTNPAIAIATVVIAFANVATWLEVHEGSTQTNKLVVASEKIKSALEKANQQNRDALEKTVTQNRQSLAGTLKQSQEALDSSMAASRLSERPWVTPSTYKLSSEPEATKDFFITLGFINTGKTPAIDVIPQSRISVWPQEPSPPKYQFATQYAVTRGRGIIAPGTFAHAMETTSDPFVLDEAQIIAYKSGATAMYLQMRLQYKDTFGFQHWTTVCITHRYGKPLTDFQFCEHGNDIDHQ